MAGEPSLRREAFAHPGKDALDDRFRVLPAIVLLAWAGPLFPADGRFHRIPFTDPCQRRGSRFGFDGLRLKEAAAGVRPARRRRDPGLGRIVGIGVVAVGQPDRPLGRAQARSGFDVFDLATREAGETDLVAFPLDRPEVGLLQLARSRLPGLDQRLVHGLDPGFANRGELGLVDHSKEHPKERTCGAK